MESNSSNMSKLLDEKKIAIGICAMEKKVNSKHMQNILKGFNDFEEFETIMFTEEIIFNLDVEVNILKFFNYIRIGQWSMH
jgi:hypothetical protein